jgi:RNA polymerase sigma-70 factor (ECF subfamily)
VSPSLTVLQPEVAEFEDEIFDRYAPAIYHFAFQHLGNRPDAEDVTTRVFLQVTRLGPPPDESTWRLLLFRVARAEIMEVCRQHGPLVASHQRALLSDDELAKTDGDSDVASRWRHCLEELDPTPWRLVELRFLAGHSLAVTARALGVGERDVQHLQHEALRQAADIIAARN